MRYLDALANTLFPVNGYVLYTVDGNYLTSDVMNLVRLASATATRNITIKNNPLTVNVSKAPIAVNAKQTLFLWREVAITMICTAIEPFHADN